MTRHTDEELQAIEIDGTYDREVYKGTVLLSRKSDATRLGRRAIADAAYERGLADAIEAIHAEQFESEEAFFIRVPHTVTRIRALEVSGDS